MDDLIAKPITLEAVPPILAAIKRVIGCRVDSFAVTMSGDTWLHLDVADDEFVGKIDRAALGEALVRAAVAACGQKLSYFGECTNEGCLITLYLMREEDGSLVLEVGL